MAKIHIFCELYILFLFFVVIQSSFLWYFIPYFCGILFRIFAVFSLVFLR